MFMKSANSSHRKQERKDGRGEEEEGTKREPDKGREKENIRTKRMYSLLLSHM